jgi:hypothetical protein
MPGEKNFVVVRPDRAYGRELCTILARPVTSNVVIIDSREPAYAAALGIRFVLSDASNTDRYVASLRRVAGRFPKLTGVVFNGTSAAANNVFGYARDRSPLRRDTLFGLSVLETYDALSGPLSQAQDTKGGGKKAGNFVSVVNQVDYDTDTLGTAVSASIVESATLHIAPDAMKRDGVSVEVYHAEGNIVERRLEIAKDLAAFARTGHFPFSPE